MRKLLLLATMASLTGCYAVEPSPYYGGAAPYYGTAYAPAYLGVSVVGGGYYPYHSSQHIHSGYNDEYWRHQHAAAHPTGGVRASGMQGGHPTGGGGHAGGEGHGGGEGHR